MSKTKIAFTAVLLFAAVLLYGCSGEEESKTIKIAVTGSPSVYSEYFEMGIKKAYEIVCNQYKDSGYDIQLEFYDDKGNYEKGNEITAELVNDKELTAIIASSSPDICDSQIYQTDKAGKILICPHWTYDDTLEEANYKRVFSLNYSNKDTGLVMRRMAEFSPAKKWALCCSDNPISRDEASSFYRNESTEDINVVDSVRINTMISDFDRTVERWKLLGVEGVVLIPSDDEGFELLYKLKEEMPELYVVSDSRLDDSKALFEHLDAFNNVYIVSQFNSNIAPGSDPGLPEYEVQDTWEIHGYNALRMIVDTAVKNNTSSCDRIAEILHEKGYSGEYQQFMFQDNGMAVYKYFSCLKTTKEGLEDFFVISEDNESSEQGILNGKIAGYSLVSWEEQSLWEEQMRSFANE